MKVGTTTIPLAGWGVDPRRPEEGRTRRLAAIRQMVEGYAACRRWNSTWTWASSISKGGCGREPGAGEIVWSPSSARVPNSSSLSGRGTPRWAGPISPGHGQCPPLASPAWLMVGGARKGWGFYCFLSLLSPASYRRLLK